MLLVGLIHNNHQIESYDKMFPIMTGIARSFGQLVSSWYC